MRRAALFLICALALAAPAGAQQVAGPVTAFDPPSVAAALRARNYPADVRRTNDGGWFVSAQMGQTPFQAILLNCAQTGTRCTDLQLFARLEANDAATLERINAWNARSRFARAYLDQTGRPVLEMDLSVEGGVGPTNIGAMLDTWGGALGAFVTHMRARRER